MGIFVALTARQENPYTRSPFPLEHDSEQSSAEKSAAGLHDGLSVIDCDLLPSLFCPFLLCVFFFFFFLAFFFFDLTLH